jgi:hypothetical protein
MARQASDSVYDNLMRLAQHFDELGDDLLRGSIEVPHPELMPQNRD